MGQYGDFDRGNPNYERNRFDMDLIEKRRNQYRQRTSKDNHTLGGAFIFIVIAFCLFDLISKAIHQITF